jgi:hypothetical protein
MWVLGSKYKPNLTDLSALLIKRCYRKKFTSAEQIKSIEKGKPG